MCVLYRLVSFTSRIWDLSKSHPWYKPDSCGVWRNTNQFWPSGSNLCISVKSESKPSGSVGSRLQTSLREHRSKLRESNTRKHAKTLLRGFCLKQIVHSLI